MSDAAEVIGTPKEQAQARFLLIAAIFLLATCGLIYELVAGALSSYLLGDSVRQFSIVIGLFLAAMGVGSWLSKYINRHLLTWFIGMEVAVGLLGGTMATLGFVAFAYTELYSAVLLSISFVVGALIGMEIPLVIRLVRRVDPLPTTLARVLSADYIGALAASVLFPFMLVPHLGLVRAGLVTGLANVLIALLLLWRLGPLMPERRRGITVFAIGSFVMLATLIPVSQRLVTFLEDRVYQDEIIYAEDTGLQRLVLTRWNDDVRLYLNGHLQFSGVDEYRYHEALVHVPLTAAARRERVLILGGGDGLAAREVLRYSEVAHIDLVDLDPAVTTLFQTRELLTAFNGNSLNDPRVQVINDDAMRYVQNYSGEAYDCILVDLPDPSDPALGKLYSLEFYALIARHLAEGGTVCCQATSPFRARTAFWTIANTLDATPDGRGSTLEVAPFHIVVPTFGTWGFVMASREAVNPAELSMTLPMRYLTQEFLPTCFTFPADMARVDTDISRLDTPSVVHAYRADYHKYLD